MLLVYEVSEGSIMVLMCQDHTSQRLLKHWYWLVDFKLNHHLIFQFNLSKAIIVGIAAS